MSSPCSFVAIHLSTADRPPRQERWLTTRSGSTGQIIPLQGQSGASHLVSEPRSVFRTSPRLAMPESASSPARVRRPSVLLVEAEAMLRLTMTKFLQRSGYQVTACSDAAAAETRLGNGEVRPWL